MRALEEVSSWPNREELYIRLFKEAVKTHAKEVDSLLEFWEHCVDRRARIHNLAAKNLLQLYVSSSHVELTVEELDFSSL